MKKLIFYFLVIVCLCAISCSINKQTARFLPLWWDQPVEGEISSFGSGIHPDEKTARFAAQNDAYQKINGKIAGYLNQHIANNCIESGDEQLQTELDKIFRHFLNYFANLKKPEITSGEDEFVRITVDRKNSIEYFTRLYLDNKYVNAEFVEFLETSDIYILPKLRNVLKECFKE
jgi:hypothetical protein